jgi:hypothetical protein
MRRIAGGLAALWLAGCGGSPDSNQSGEAALSFNESAPAPAPAPAPAAGAPAETVLKSETVEAVFTGWEVGDYVWANLDVKGRETAGAWVGPPPLEHFLEAHKGKPITVRLDTVAMEVPEAGGKMEIEKIADARAGALTAAAWWKGLSAGQKQAAERRIEAVLGPAPE